MKRKMMFWSLILLLLVPGQFAFADEEKSLEQVAEQVIEPRYLSILKQWNEVGQGNAQDFERVVTPADFLSIDENSLLSSGESKEYGDRSMLGETRIPSRLKWM
ncbi:hypothetical protein K7887_18860 [Sutcliffiella horikoshii]|uniref:hypothetical protein n=1 Tax=Sutcliffiella horikoshii TaxID=79883 RepID=UPI001CBCB6A6|nr:hypothetical protein [Sutcliffiella horikoshii]UAL46900.1 hypothetical protein K7887_18860 [Sutcliffiella horikoshii]